MTDDGTCVTKVADKCVSNSGSATGAITALLAADQNGSCQTLTWATIKWCMSSTDGTLTQVSETEHLHTTSLSCISLVDGQCFESNATVDITAGDEGRKADGTCVDTVSANCVKTDDTAAATTDNGKGRDINKRCRTVADDYCWDESLATPVAVAKANATATSGGKYVDGNRMCVALKDTECWILGSTETDLLADATDANNRGRKADGQCVATVLANCVKADDTAAAKADNGKGKDKFGRCQTVADDFCWDESLATPVAVAKANASASSGGKYVNGNRMCVSLTDKQCWDSTNNVAFDLGLDAAKGRKSDGTCETKTDVQCMTADTAGATSSTSAADENGVCTTILATQCYNTTAKEAQLTTQLKVKSKSQQCVTLTEAQCYKVFVVTAVT
jgi:hypothetical protein